MREVYQNLHPDRLRLAGEVQEDFCTERDLLAASIEGYRATPSLEDLDAQVAAEARLLIVEDALPALRQAKDTYEAAERAAAILAVQAPVWAAAATEKTTQLSTITTLVIDLLAAVEAYGVAHQQQMSCLFSLGHYTPTFRGNYGPMTSRLGQIVGACCHEDPGQHAWGRQQLSTFDAIGTSAALPTEY